MVQKYSNKTLVEVFYTNVPYYDKKGLNARIGKKVFLSRKKVPIVHLQ